jgi:hypothetical protein
MTIPNEWFLSLKNTRNFLKDLLDSGKTPRVPKEIRERAADCLKHFPWDTDLAELENVYKASNTNKSVILDKTNKELNHVAAEVHMAQRNLNEVASVLQHFINKT